MTTSDQADMKMAAVPSYVMEKTGIKRSRATVYNWATKGVAQSTGSVKLRVDTRAGQMFTKIEWVDDFLALIDQR